MKKSKNPLLIIAVPAPLRDRCLKIIDEALELSDVDYEMFFDDWITAAENRLKILSKV